MISPRVIRPAKQRLTFTLDDGRTFAGTWDGYHFVANGVHYPSSIVRGWLPDATDRQTADVLRRFFRGEAA